MEIIKLKRPYITLGQLLQVSGFADSGAQAKTLVKELTIFVNQKSENRRGRKLVSGDLVSIAGKRIEIE